MTTRPGRAPTTTSRACTAHLVARAARRRPARRRLPDGRQPGRPAAAGAHARRPGPGRVRRPGPRRRARRRSPTQVSPRVLEAPGQLDDVARELDEYFAGRRTAFDVPLDLRLLRGFRRDVVEHLPDIAYGRTASYARDGRRSPAARGRSGRSARRARSTRCRVVLPCHRVVRSDGSPGQYAGGADGQAGAARPRDARRGRGVASVRMCRNITTLRGLEPPATSEEIEAAARQYVRKVTGVQTLSDATREPFEDAVAADRRDHRAPARRAARAPAAADDGAAAAPRGRAGADRRRGRRTSGRTSWACPHEHEDDARPRARARRASRAASRTSRGMPVGRDRGEREEARLGAVQPDVLVERPRRSVGELHAARAGDASRDRRRSSST